MKHSEARRINEQKLREMGYRPGPTGESFSDFLTMKVLARKRIEQYGNPFGANAFTIFFAQNKLLRNVCVRVDPFRSAELDALTELLNCNKQEFVLELLVAGIEQAKVALREAGLEPAFDAAVDKTLEDAGFSVTPNKEGFLHSQYQGELMVNKHAERHQQAAETAMSIVSKTIEEDVDDQRP